MKNCGFAVPTVMLFAGLTAGIAQAQTTPLRPVLKQDAPQGEVTFAPVIACFAEGTDPLYVHRVNTVVDQMNLVRFGSTDYQLTGRWSGAAGSPRALTWSFVPDGLSISSGIGEAVSGSVLFATLDAGFAAQGGRATWVNRFVQVFARWQALSGLTYTRVTVGGNDWDDGAAWGSAAAGGLRGDVRISAHPLDGGNGVLAYNFFPSSGDMVLDSQDSGNWASSGNANRFLRNVVAHEHGHGMGLLHVCPANATKLMEPYISTAYDGPRQDDTRASQRHYGDPFEPNDTAATAKPLGALAIPGSISYGTQPAPIAGTSDGNAALLSIDTDGESDFWSFTITAPALVTVTATPVGSTYLNAPQDSACNTGAAFNALTVSDLIVSVISSNGSTVLGTSSSQPVGVAETLSNLLLPSAGTYYVRITEANSPFESQLYRLSLSATSGTVECPTVVTQPSPQTTCEGTPVSLTFVASGAPAPTYQWRKNLVSVAGATSSTYSIAAPITTQSGSYDCVATNACGSVISDAVMLAVNSVPNITTQPTDQTAAVGSPVTFSVVATGSVLLDYQWRKGGTPIAGATNASYSIASVQPSDAGGYDCFVSNNCDYVFSDIVTLTVTNCYANCDQSTSAPILNANDFQCFLNQFAAADPIANCDGSTAAPVLNANDFQCFLNAFAAGCP